MKKVYIVYFGCVYPAFNEEDRPTITEKIEKAFILRRNAVAHIKARTGRRIKGDYLKIKDKTHNLYYEYYEIKSTELE